MKNNPFAMLDPARATNPFRQRVYNYWFKHRIPGQHVQMLYGYLGIDCCHVEMTDAQIRLCEMLSSEHGLTVLKALQLKHEEGV